MAEGIDYSYARPGGAAIAAAGKEFAVRYLYPDGQGGKGLDASELADLRAHGIAVPVVFESSSSRALDGYAAGAADAATSEGQLQALGMGTLPVYFAVDFNATQAQMGAIDQYLLGAASVLGVGRTGVYGGLAVIQHVQDSGAATWFWQTYAWSSSRWADGTHLQQYRNGQTINGGGVDFCRSMVAEYGQNPPTPPKPKDPDMENIYQIDSADGARVKKGEFYYWRDGISFPVGPLSGTLTTQGDLYRLNTIQRVPITPIGGGTYEFYENLLIKSAQAYQDAHGETGSGGDSAGSIATAVDIKLAPRFDALPEAVVVASGKALSNG